MRTDNITFGSPFLLTLLTLILLCGNGAIAQYLNLKPSTFLAFCFMFISVVIANWITNSIYKRINKIKDEIVSVEVNSRIRNFINYSLDDKQYKGYFRRLEVPIYGIDNEKNGEQSLFSYLHDKREEYIKQCQNQPN